MFLPTLILTFAMKNKILGQRCFNNVSVVLSGVQIEPWFETPFKEETLPANTMKIWANSPSVDPALHMPVHNEFIPHDFTIHTTGKEHTHPSCLLDSAALKVWHKIDRKFSTPRTNAFFSITLSAGTKCVEDAVLAQLYVVQLKNELNKMLYLVRLPLHCRDKRWVPFDVSR